MPRDAGHNVAAIRRTRMCLSLHLGGAAVRLKRLWSPHPSYLDHWEFSCARAFPRPEAAVAPNVVGIEMSRVALMAVLLVMG